MTTTDTTVEPTRTERIDAIMRELPYVEFMRAAIAFDECCRYLCDFAHDMKNAMLRYDMTPEVEQLEAMLFDRARQYIGSNWEPEVREAINALVLATLRPEDGWSEE